MAACRIRSDVTVQRGVNLEMRIHVPGLRWPLMIDQAQVLWLRGDTFGLVFLGLRDSERERLGEVISELADDGDTECMPAA